MASTELRMPIRRLMRETTMHVTITGMRVFKVRQWIAVRLMALAAVVLGCRSEIDVQIGTEQ